MALSALRQACSINAAAKFSSPLTRPLLRTAAVRCVAASAANGVAGVGDSVSVHYTGTLDDGTIFDTSRAEGRTPLEFVIGSGKVIKGFDKVVTGLKVGESNKLRVEPTDAYGERNEDMVGTLPAASAPEGLEAGMQVRLSNGQPAFVTEVTEETVTIDANHALASLHLTFDVELLSLEQGAPQTAVAVETNPNLDKITFAGGCFWGPELAFQRVEGVVATEVGYTNGAAQNPTYQQVCTGGTGHTECVQVTYDKSVVSMESLFDVLWATMKDPTQANGQGNDRGSQYRTGIYYHNDEQRIAAQKSLDAMQAKYNGKVATELKPLDNYSTAEDYHQQYLSNGKAAVRPQSAEKGCTDNIRCYG